MAMGAADLERLIEPLVEQEEAEIVDLRFAREGPRWMLRVYLDKPGGLTLDDCAYFSDRIGALLEESGVIERSYVLEVSSPGLDRVIKKEKDFERFSGRAVKVRLKFPEAGQRHFRGILRGLREGRLILSCEGRDLELVAESLDEVRLDEAAEI